MKLISEFLKLENGEPEGYNSEAYCYYFYENIQIYEDGFVEKKNRKPEDKDSHDRYSKGVTINEFARLFGSLYKDENEHYEEFGKILTNKRLQKLQIELLDKGINVCMLNIFYLAKYILYKCKNYTYMKLKPRIEDTLSELNKVKEITFLNEDGSKATSNNGFLIDTIIKALESENGNDLNEVKAEFITWDKLSNKEFIQTYFIHDMTMFLNEYFKVKRRKGALISTKEQELIIYLMYLLELTPAEVSDSRFRQLKAKFEQINQQLHLCNFDLGDGRKFQKHIGFIPYKVWKNGKINWNALDEDAFALSENMHYKFT